MRAFALALLLGTAASAAPIPDARLPATTGLVGHFGKDGMIVVSQLEHAPSPPGCLAALKPHIEGYYQVQLDTTPTPVFLFQGDAPRVDIERCAAQIGFMLTTKQTTLHSEGPLSFIGGEQPFVLGFGSGVVVEHADAAVVKATLAQLAGKGPAPSAAQLAMLKRVDRSDGVWGMSLRNYAAAFGLTSTGMVLTGTAGGTMTARLLFATPAEAKRLVAAFDHPPFAKDHAALAATLHGMAKADGATAIVDLSGALKKVGDAGLMPEATLLLQTKPR
jgi:hypothetical protein